jgi:hypothetical protein
MTDKVGEILADIGRLLVEIVGSEPDGIMLYAEGVRAVSAGTIFKDMGDHVLCYFPYGELSKRLFRLWDLTTDTEKWVALIYTISDGRFDARFEYPNETAEDFYDDRRNRIEAEKYGNKRIVYVPRADYVRGEEAD